MPRACRLVTPYSRMPQGTMPPKWPRSGSTFSATPCQLTQRVTRTPMAPILASAPVAGSATQMPTRPSRRSPLDVEAVEGADQPFLQPVDVAADVVGRDAAVRTGQVEHDVGGALARAVIGPLAAAAGFEGGETGRDRSILRAWPRCRRCRAAGARPARPVRAAVPARMAATRACIAARAAGYAVRPSAMRHSEGVSGRRVSGWVHRGH